MFSNYTLFFATMFGGKGRLQVFLSWGGGGSPAVLVLHGIWLKHSVNLFLYCSNAQWMRQCTKKLQLLASCLLLYTEVEEHVTTWGRAGARRNKMGNLRYWRIPCSLFVVPSIYSVLMNIPANRLSIDSVLYARKIEGVNESNYGIPFAWVSIFPWDLLESI